MRILLAYKSGRPGAGDYFARMMPVGLGWINATLAKEGFDTRLANLSRVPWREVRDLLSRERPDLVGITLYTFNRHAGLRLASMARDLLPGCAVIVGGPHATHVGRSILRNHPAVTAVGIGEGEITMLEAARALRAGRPLAGVAGLLIRPDGDQDGDPISTGPRETISNLDALPFPSPYYRGHHLDVEAESSFLITSRGCPARCTFCNTPDFWGTRMRFRGPASMIEEIRHLRDRLGLLYVSIRDDTFTVNKRRVIEFCRLLVEANLGLLWNCQSRVNAIDEERLSWMRRAGCEHIQYGIESGSPRLLERLAKDISIDQIRAASRATRKVGMILSIYLISGVPEETEEDARATEALVAEILPHDGLVAPLAVFPGTHLYERMKSEGRIDDDDWIRERRDTIYLMDEPAAGRSFRRLTALCRRVGRKAAYTRADLEAHKSLLPDAFPAWLASGEAYEAAGDAGSALSDYETALRVSPDNPWALMRIGSLLERTGDPDGAALYYRQALAGAPQNRLARELLETIGPSSGGRPARRRHAPAGAP